MSQHDRYISPFSTRYASDEMQYIFSDDNKFRTWRRLWVALARAEMKQGLTNITPEMVAELEAHVDDINYEVAIEREKLVRHDVMSHVYAYGQQCPKAAGIIHLGATSCYVGDNTDIIVMRQGLELVPDGVLDAVGACAGWLNVDDPTLLLHTNALFDALRTKLDTDRFSALLKEIFSAEPVQVLQVQTLPAG